MHTVLLVYGFAFVLILVVAAFLAMGNGPSLSRKFARIRVRLDERRRQRFQEPTEDEFEIIPLLEWLALGVVLLLLLLLLARA
jgi:hypothetical protein